LELFFWPIMPIMAAPQALTSKRRFNDTIASRTAVYDDSAIGNLALDSVCDACLKGTQRFQIVANQL
jgi:hypothetical protein